MKFDEPHYPGRPPIDAYGNGGFRFADMSHRGSIQILPSGVYAWRPAIFADAGEGDFDKFFAQADAIELLLIGTGAQLTFVPEPLKLSLRARHLRFETMDTGGAARTYNVLLGEKRLVAAALIAVD